MAKTLNNSVDDFQDLQGLPDYAILSRVMMSASENVRRKARLNGGATATASGARGCAETCALGINTPPHLLADALVGPLSGRSGDDARGLWAVRGMCFS